MVRVRGARVEGVGGSYQQRVEIDPVLVHVDFLLQVGILRGFPKQTWEHLMIPGERVRQGVQALLGGCKWSCRIEASHDYREIVVGLRSESGLGLG
jgi:hypothetical protein